MYKKYKKIIVLNALKWITFSFLLVLNKAYKN